MFETQITARRAESMRRDYLQGRTSGDAVADERKITLEMLAAHGRLSAFMALAKGRSSGFGDFMMMRGALLAGGLRRVRRNSLEPAGRRSLPAIAGGSGMPGSICGVASRS